MSPNKKSYRSKKKSNKTLFLAIGIIAIILISVAGYVVLTQSAKPANATPTPTPAPSNTNPTKVLLQTSAGDITIELRSDKPITTANFINIVQQGLYDGTTFFRTMTGFMIQGGQVTSTSIPTIPDEIGTDNHNVAYTIAMAKTSDPNSATSQFFINAVDNGNNPIDQAGTKFDAVYTVFGNVTVGQSVVDAIANAQVTTNPYNGEPSVPLHPVTIIKASIVT